MEYGIDVILGGALHVAQPMEKCEFKDPFTGEVKNGFIICSLGDFVAYHIESGENLCDFDRKEIEEKN